MASIASSRSCRPLLGNKKLKSNPNIFHSNKKGPVELNPPGLFCRYKLLAARLQAANRIVNSTMQSTQQVTDRRRAAALRLALDDNRLALRFDLFTALLFAAANSLQKVTNRGRTTATLFVT
jgi:hypothetical protein